MSWFQRVIWQRSDIAARSTITQACVECKQLAEVAGMRCIRWMQRPMDALVRGVSSKARNHMTSTVVLRSSANATLR
jgi:hypothetical protein